MKGTSTDLNQIDLYPMYEKRSGSERKDRSHLEPKWPPQKVRRERERVGTTEQPTELKLDPLSVPTTSKIKDAIRFTTT